MMPDFKGAVLSAVYGRWRPAAARSCGYTVVLPTPADMPFLLRYGLEGLRHIDTTDCRQILIVSDGCAPDRGESLRDVAAEFGDPRIRFLSLGMRERMVLPLMRRSGAAALHWMMSVLATDHAAGDYVFLHDSDAFWLGRDGLQRQYRESRDRGMSVLGVQARWDPFFTNIGYSIAGTWELMFSNDWARSRPPYTLKGRKIDTPHGTNEFDSMLYPQYLDYPAGKVGVMAEPPEFVHFSGTIVTYRQFRSAGGRTVVDELFRVLLLALLEELIPADDGTRVVPTVAELSRGLREPGAPVSYQSDVCASAYPEFRRMVDDLCRAPVFAGERASRLRELIAPFDAHFADLPAARDPDRSAKHSRFRYHGLSTG